MNSLPLEGNVTPQSLGVIFATQLGGRFGLMTLTANEQEAGFWQASAQEQVTVVVPSGNGSVRGLPSLRTQVETSAPLQLSVAKTAASLGAGTAVAHWTVTLVGMLVMTGAVSSIAARFLADPSGWPTFTKLPSAMQDVR